MAIAGELPLLTAAGGESKAARSKPDPDQVNTLIDLYRHHQQRIYRYCLALLRNPDDAEDATQETFTRAAPFLPNLPGDLSAYLTTVARNICCDVVRARARRSVPIETVPLADRKVSPERQSVDWDVVRRMWRQLTPSERLLFAYTFAGYKYEEIASRTGMSRPSVSVGLARARRRLRDLAAATGTLGLLPLGIRRWLDRAGRRAGNALANIPAGVLGLVDQVGSIAAGLLSGIFVLSALAPALAPAVATVPRSANVALAKAPTNAGTVAATSSAPAGTTERQAAAPPHNLALSILPRSVAGGLVGADATPQDTAVQTMVASPNYPSDHTLFVGGQVQKNCTYGPECSALFRSDDAGATWQRLAYLQTLGIPQILLPDDFPADPAFFVVLGDSTLRESPTGNGTFSWMVPGVTTAAIAPGSTPGHERLAVLIGDSLYFYGAGASTPQAGPMLPANFMPQTIVFTGPDTLEVGGWQATPTLGVTTPSVTACPTRGVCSATMQLPGVSGGSPFVAVSPNVAADHVVVAVANQALYVSRDAGQHFTKAAVPPVNYSFQSATLAPGSSGPRIVVFMLNGYDGRAGMLRSDDVGRTFTDITGDLGMKSFLAGMAAYPDGTILAAIRSDARGKFALRQTTGNGTWIRPS